MLILGADSEGVPVCLPCNSSGETNPILRYMNKSCCAPLVISVSEEIPTGIENNDSEVGNEHVESDPRSAAKIESEHGNTHQQPPKPRSVHPLTMSEFLRLCAQPRMVEVEEEEDEEEEAIPLPEFDAHFLADPPRSGPFVTCHIPILCMADEDRLPVLMAALLHQRRTWHIDEPLIGIQFSTYSTTISLFVGWLEDEVGPGCVLVGVMTSLRTLCMSTDLVSSHVCISPGSTQASRWICLRHRSHLYCPAFFSA